MDFDINEFFQIGRQVQYNKHDYILRLGAVSSKVYYVKKGIVRHYLIDNDGKDKTIRLSKEGDLFYSSNISFWRQEPSYVNCQTLTDCDLMYWTKSQLDDLSKVNKDFVLFELSKLKDFIIEKHKKEISRLTKNARERLVEFNEFKLELFNRIPHHIIASYLDMTPETLSRLRANSRKKKS